MLKNKHLLYVVPLLVLTSTAFKKEVAEPIVTIPVKTGPAMFSAFWFPVSYSTQPKVKVPARRINGSDVLFPDEILYHDDYLQSPDGRHRLIMQQDGNLVLYYTVTNTPVWASNTCCNSSINRCVMQPDGNLVVYDTSDYPHWSSGTAEYSHAYAVLTNCGEVLIIQGGYVRWYSPSCCRC